jgi:hypothetical protein
MCRAIVTPPPGVEPLHRPEGRRQPRRAGSGHRQRPEQRVFAAADFDHLHPANQYKIILEVDPRLQGDPSALDRIYVAGSGDAQVPLSAVVKMERGLTPLSVFHQASFPSNTISFNA